LNDYSSALIENVSAVEGDTVSEALDNLNANAGVISSVFGRIGAIAAQANDYSSTLVENLSGIAGTTVTTALNAIGSALGSLTTAIDAKPSSVFGRGGDVAATAGDYTSSLITNASAVAGATVTLALNALNTAITGKVTSIFGRTGVVVAAAGDYTGGQITNTSTVAGSVVSTALTNLLTAINTLSNFGTRSIETTGFGSFGTTATLLQTSNVGAARRVVCLGLGADVTATDMPVNSGDNVIPIGNAVTEPSASAAGTVGSVMYCFAGSMKARSVGVSNGTWTFAPASVWSHQFASDNTGTTDSVNQTTIATFSLASLPSDCGGVVKVYLQIRDANSVIASQVISGSFIKIGNVLSITSLGVIEGSSLYGAAALSASGTNMLVNINSSDTTLKNYKAMTELTWALKA
jgi:hypothetical protein